MTFLFLLLPLYKSRQLERSHLSLISLTAGARARKWFLERERERDWEEDFILSEKELKNSQSQLQVSVAREGDPENWI